MRSHLRISVGLCIASVLLARAATAGWPLDGTVVSDLNSAYTTQVVATSDGEGGALVGWIDWRGFSTTRSDMFLKRVRHDGSLDPLWPLKGTLVCGAEASQANPALCPDGSGGGFVAWMDQRGAAQPEGTVNWPVYAQAVTSSGSVVPGWPVDGKRVSPYSNVAPGTIVMAHDGDDGFYVLWQEYVEGVSELYVRHMRRDGSSSWPERGLTLTTRQGSRVSAHMVSDGTEGIYVGWKEENSSSNGVHVSRVLRSGEPAPGWPPGGVAVFAGTGAEQPSLATGEEGGVIVAWLETLSEGTAIRATRILGDGELDPRWSIGGVLLCLAPGWRQAPRVVPDGSGGAIVCWQDFREGINFESADVYVQRVTSDGIVDTQWPANGLRAGPATGTEWYPSIASDQEGGAFLLWSDYRAGVNGPSAAVAQHVLGSGQFAPGWTESGVRLSRYEERQDYPALVPGSERNVIAAVSGYGSSVSARVVAQRFNFYGLAGGAFRAQAQFEHGRIRVEWGVPDGYTQMAKVYRREADMEWQERTTLLPAAGLLSWSDEDIVAGATYEYRLGVSEGTGEGLYGYVRVPTATELLLRITDSAPSHLRITFSLPNTSPAAMEIFGVSGRRIETRDLSAYGQGTHEMTLATESRYASGIYFLRLRQGQSEARTRFVVVR